MRKISNDFIIDDLQIKKGILRPVLEKVQKDHTLLLAIRDNYINIYYRGGNILRLREQNKQTYQATFDENYAKVGQVVPVLPSMITQQSEAKIWAASIPTLKVSNLSNNKYFHKFTD